MSASHKRARFAAFGAVLCGAAACTPALDEGLDSSDIQDFNPICSAQDGFQFNQIAGAATINPEDYGWTEERLQAALSDADAYHRDASIYFFPVGEKPDLAIVADYDEPYSEGFRGRDRILFPVGVQSPMDSFSFVVSGAFSPDDVSAPVMFVRGPLDASCPTIVQPLSEGISPR